MDDNKSLVHKNIKPKISKIEEAGKHDEQLGEKSVNRKKPRHNTITARGIKIALIIRHYYLKENINIICR